MVGPFPRKRTFPKFVNVGYGYLGPQIQLQFTPLHWGLGACWGGRALKFGLRVGPFAVAVWVKPGDLTKERDWDVK